VKEPEDAVEKAKHQKDSIRAQRIIADSIKDHLIPYVSSKETPKEMFDALTKLYEGKNINRKMNLRTQLKNTKMQKGEMIQEYFSRISEIKEQLKAIGDTIDKDEFVMTALLTARLARRSTHFMKIIYVEDSRVLLGVFKHQHLYFCKRDLRTPARVIM
jgi:hypothetical protein